MLFADDTNVFIVHKQPILLKKKLKKTGRGNNVWSMWLAYHQQTYTESWKIKLSLIYSTHQRKKISVLCNQLKFGNVNVDQIYWVNYLGVNRVWWYSKLECTCQMSRQCAC